MHEGSNEAARGADSDQARIDRIQALAESIVTWSAYVEAGHLQVHDAARIGTGDDGGAGAANRVDLALSQLGRHVRMHDVVGAARTTAQTFVVELDQLCIRREHRAHVLVGPLHVAQVARVLHRDAPREPPLGQTVDALGQPLVHVAHASGEGMPRGSRDEYLGILAAGFTSPGRSIPRASNWRRRC